jgi:hypothetical protein
VSDLLHMNDVCMYPSKRYGGDTGPEDTISIEWLGEAILLNVKEADAVGHMLLEWVAGMKVKGEYA